MRRSPGYGVRVDAKPLALCSHADLMNILRNSRAELSSKMGYNNTVRATVQHAAEENICKKDQKLYQPNCNYTEP